MAQGRNFSTNSTDKPVQIQDVDNAYRIAALTHFLPGGKDTNDEMNINGEKRINYAQNETTKLYRVSIRLPSGEIEYWQQTDASADGNTNVKATAYERCNLDGTPYKTENGDKETVITFHGSSNTDQDKNAYERIIAGDDMNDHYDAVTKVTDGIIANMAARSPDGNLGNLTIGTYSAGALALGAAYHARTRTGQTQDTSLSTKYQENAAPLLPPHMKFTNVKTITLEPFAAGQALQQWTNRIARPNATKEEREALAGDILKNSTSIRSDSETIYSSLKTGDQLNDNAQAAERTFSFKTENNSITGLMENHSLPSLGNALTTHGANGLMRTKNRDVSVEELLSGGRPLTTDEITNTQNLTSTYSEWAEIVTAVFNIIKEFFFQEEPDTPRENFEDLPLPSATPAPGTQQTAQNNNNIQPKPV